MRVHGDPLPSWRETAVKASILAFVRSVADRDGPNHVEPAARVAVFDNDGTLWPEQPLYIQLAFALDRVHELAANHPEWRTNDPFKSLLAGDPHALAAGGMKALMAVLAETHSGMTNDEFVALASQWFATARHPRFERSYAELAYQPMTELLAHLRANEFRTYLVSGGGIEFMRAVAERMYGIPPEQVIGSSGRMRYEVRDGAPVLVRLPDVEFFDDKGDKVVAIQRFIGRRPIFAAGNSDGDQQMLQWTAAGPGTRMTLLIDHTDEEREYRYRTSSMGRLEAALDEARERGWPVVSMKDDWMRVFAHE
jgi:phosphoserine phosphatase